MRLICVACVFVQVIGCTARRPALSEGSIPPRVIAHAPAAHVRTKEYRDLVEAQRSVAEVQQQYEQSQEIVQDLLDAIGTVQYGGPPSCTPSVQADGGAPESVHCTPQGGSP